MTKFLMKTFLPKNTPATDPKARSVAGKLAGVVGIVCNLLLFGVKFCIGAVSGTVSVMADAINNLSDASSSIVTLIGFKLAEKPADEDHPYGHARFEYLSGLAVAVMIIVIGFELAKTSIEKIQNPEHTPLSVAMLLLLAASMLVKLWMASFNTRLGKHIDSTALLATATDSRNDCIATLAVLAAAIAERFVSWHLDGFVGLGVAAFILYSGALAIKETVSPLLGESASPELQREIVQLMQQEKDVLGYHDLMVHDYGPGQRFGSLHVEMDQKQDPLYCHELIDNLERKCLQELGVHLVIHYDPVLIGDPETDDLRQFLTETLTAYNSRLTLHDFRMVKSGHINLIFDIAIPHDLCSQEKAIRKALENALAENRQGTYYLVITFDKGASLEG